jgi:hypothetical protein
MPAQYVCGSAPHAHVSRLCHGRLDPKPRGGHFLFLFFYIMLLLLSVGAVPRPLGWTRSREKGMCAASRSAAQYPLGSAHVQAAKLSLPAAVLRLGSDSGSDRTMRLCRRGRRGQRADVTHAATCGRREPRGGRRRKSERIDTHAHHSPDSLSEMIYTRAHHSPFRNDSAHRSLMCRISSMPCP